MGRNPKDDIRKPQILEHFRQVINKEGLHNASNAKVAKHMGVSANLVAHYFESKDAMVHELLEYTVKEYTDFLSVKEKTAKSAGDRLKALLKGFFCASEGRELLIEPAFYSLYSLSLINDAFKEKFITVYRTTRETVVRTIQSAMDSGEIKQGDPKKLVELILVLLEGFTFMANLRQEGDYFEELGDYFYKKAWALLKEGDSNI